jgi:hypothetical protein
MSVHALKLNIRISLEGEVRLTLDADSITALNDLVWQAVAGRPQERLTRPIPDQRTLTPIEASQNAPFPGKKSPENRALVVDSRELSKMLKLSERKIWAMRKEGKMPEPLQLGSPFDGTETKSKRG